jgi:hypothetical protein
VICLQTVVGWSQKQRQNLSNAGFGLRFIISIFPQNTLQVADTKGEGLEVSI